MTSRFARLCSAGLLLNCLAGAWAQTPPVTPLPQNPPAPPSNNTPVATPTARPGAPGDDEMVSLKLPDADIDTVLSALEIYTGKIILRPSQLPTAPGGYNLKITKPIPKSQAILYLETILAMNNIAVLPLGDDALKIVQLPQARVEAPELILGSTLEMPPSSKVASKLFQLDFLRVQEFQQMLQNVTNPNFGAATPLANANAILITDTISNLQRIETLLQQVDKPSMGGMATKFYQLRNGAKASEVVARLTGILTGTIQQQLGMGTRFSADDRSNQVILITDPRQFAFFDDLIAKLDVKADPNTRNEVIYLKHAKASDVVGVISNLIRGQSNVTKQSGSVRPTQGMQPNAPQLGQPQAPVAPTVISASSSANPALDQGSPNEFSSLVTVVNDDRSNSVVVSGTVDDIRLLQQLIDKLDIVLAQVRIEVVIAEVTLEDNHQSGIDSLGLKLDGDRLVGFTASAPSISVGGNDANSFASISRIGGPGSLGRSLDLVGIINIGTTPRKNNTTILSVPSITTSHAKEANIFVGETHPIVTGTVNAGTLGGTTSTTSQQQIGINLTVTPLIGVDGSVQLDIKQDVDEVGPDVLISGNPVPIIFKRTTSSFVSVKNNEIVVLGGLQRQVATKSRNRLGPIPIIGDLFGSRQKNEKRTELIFFLRPHVLTNTPVDNTSTMERIDTLPQRDAIKGLIDPNYQPPKKSVLDNILPK